MWSPLTSAQFLRGINTLFLNELQHAGEAYSEVFSKSPRTRLVKVRRCGGRAPPVGGGGLLEGRDVVLGIGC